MRSPNGFLSSTLVRPGPDPEELGSEDETGETESTCFGLVRRSRRPGGNRVRRASMDACSGHPWPRRVGHLLPYAAEKEIGNDAHAMRTLPGCTRPFTSEGLSVRFVESDQSIDRVMNIFIRVNAQGEPLSFADLPPQLGNRGVGDQTKPASPSMLARRYVLFQRTPEST